MRPEANLTIPKHLDGSMPKAGFRRFGTPVEVFSSSRRFKQAFFGFMFRSGGWWRSANED